MNPEDRMTQEAIVREQEDDAQVLDAADMESRDATNFGGEDTIRGNPEDLGEVAPDDRPDLVETMTAMTASGHIDNGAFEGERNDDDEESMLGNTESEDEGLDGLTVIEDTGAPYTDEDDNEL